ncbi:MAG: NusG domain II-containing protein [Limnochordia bacterium]|nr:NusG domain II-containing protein [Bacillota bacterium]HOB09761.1 NusG domain II-containing protein [Limnochordia bacterium]HPT93888.1 NusG domain II-containing protein [Limnochordia bacterium]HPZ31711.1 NusG domain II-containing protein [Limnochordia bacterium]HQD71500.1 NusG domain II-containing protein [Limnochordia bacterium]
MKIRKGDLLIFVVLLLIGGIMLTSNLFRAKEPGNIAILEIDGVIVERFDLDADLENYRAETARGYNILDFADGAVRVIEADCPDKICIQFGWIRQVGQTIVCLPHRLIIRVVSEASEQQLDGVAY